jgi:iron complex transport system ATP-binding protein
MTDSRLEHEIEGHASQSAGLEATDISVWYDLGHRGDPQLRGVTLALAQGLITAVIGPNGSGKTALVRTLSRTLAPHIGVVSLNGRDLYKHLTAKESALAISVVPQMTEMFLDFTVRDIVAMGRAPHRAARSAFAPDTREDEAAVDEALSAMQIDETLAKRPISAVSGGERQRALVARALAQQSEILLLDEPTASLDLKAQHSLLGTLRSLAHESGKTVLVVLHDLNAAAEYADRVLLLSEGTVAAVGAPDEVLQPHLIEHIYGVKVQIGANPVTGRPNVIVVP